MNKSQITGLKLTEISLVDRPANPDAVFTCFKADKPKDGEEAADKGDEPTEKTDETPADDTEKADDKADKKVDDKEDDKKDETEKSASVELSDSEIAILKAVLAKAEKHEGELKYEPADESVSKSDKSDDLAKAEMADELAKAQDALKKSNDALAKAQAEIEILKKQAAPPKGSTKAIGKAEDNGEDPLKGFQPIVKNDGSLDDVATLVKAAHTGRL